MNQRIAHIAIVVKEYDEAISFYTNKLNFRLIEDTRMSDTKRWVLVAPQGNHSTAILLAKAATAEQESRIGNQTGGRVGFFLFTDNFERDYTSYRNNGVEFVREPIKESYGNVAVFSDLYGNLWDLIEPALQ